MDATPPPASPSLPDVAPPEPSSLLDRLTNVIAAPGEAFAGLRNAPVMTAHWLVPLTLACLGGIFYCIMAFSQPTVVRGMQEAREKAMQQQVAAGKMTQAQADQASAMMEKFMSPTILKIFGAGGALVYAALGLFLTALGLWLGLKAFSEARLDYMKLVEICGLALVINIPQIIIRTWLVTWKENMLVTASPTLFLANPDMHNKLHVLLAALDIIDFWWLGVLMIGVSKVAGVSYRTAGLIAVCVWLCSVALRVLFTK